MVEEYMLDSPLEVVNQNMKIKWGSSHNTRIQNPKSLKKVIKQLALDIKQYNTSLPKKQKIGAIVCCGISGAGVSFPLWAKLGIPVWLVRKEGEKSHSCNDVDFNWSTLPDDKTQTINYIVIDDLIDSGRTMRRIVSVMESFSKHKTHLLKAFLYNECNNLEREYSLYMDNNNRVLTIPCKSYSGYEWCENG